MYEDKTIEVFRKDQYEASNHENLKVIENSHVRKQVEKVRFLTLRLKECETENQVLEKNLNFMKQLICREIGSNYFFVQEWMSVKRERMEDVFLLKNAVGELRNYLSHLEDGLERTRNVPNEECINQQLLAERKAFWRMELERRLADKTAQKEMNPISKEKHRLHAEWRAEKKRLHELNGEISLLRGEIETERDKKEKNKNIAKSCQNIENQLQESLLERREIRQELVDVRARNERMNREIRDLKEESASLADDVKMKDSLIVSCMEKKKKIQKAIEKKKVFFQKNVEYYKSEFEEFKSRSDEEDSVRKRILEGHQILTDLDRDLSIGSFDGVRDEEENTAMSRIQSTDLEHSSREMRNDDSKGSMAVHESDDVDYSNEKFEMFLDWIKYKCLLETTDHHKELLSSIAQRQRKQVSELEILNNEIKKEIKKKVCQKNILFKKFSKCRKLYSKKKTDVSLKSKNELEVLFIKIKYQKEANTFLRSLLGALFEITAQEFVQCKTFLVNRKEFYFNTLLDISSITSGGRKSPRSEINQREQKDEVEGIRSSNIHPRAS